MGIFNRPIEGIGALLFKRAMMWFNENVPDKANFQSLMSGREKDKEPITLDLQVCAFEILPENNLTSIGVAFDFRGNSGGFNQGSLDEAVRCLTEDRHFKKRDAATLYFSHEQSGYDMYIDENAISIGRKRSAPYDWDAFVRYIQNAGRLVNYLTQNVIRVKPKESALPEEPKDSAVIRKSGGTSVIRKRNPENPLDGEYTPEQFYDAVDGGQIGAGWFENKEKIRIIYGGTNIELASRLSSKGIVKVNARVSLEGYKFGGDRSKFDVVGSRFAQRETSMGENRLDDLKGLVKYVVDAMKPAR